MMFKELNGNIYHSFIKYFQHYKFFKHHWYPISLHTIASGVY